MCVPLLHITHTLRMYIVVWSYETLSLFQGSLNILIIIIGVEIMPCGIVFFSHAYCRSPRFNFFFGFIDANNSCLLGIYIQILLLTPPRNIFMELLKQCSAYGLVISESLQKIKNLNQAWVLSYFYWAFFRLKNMT